MTKAKSKTTTADDIFEDDDSAAVVDFSNVEDLVNEVIPAGKYPCTITGLEFKLSAASNLPMWAVQLDIIDGEYEGRKLFYNISFSPKALVFFKPALKAIKPELLTGKFNAEEVADSGELLGIEVIAKTNIGMYEGEKKTQVKMLLPAKSSSTASKKNDFLD
jgi:hypothetical protein